MSCLPPTMPRRSARCPGMAGGLLGTEAQSSAREFEVSAWLRRLFLHMACQASCLHSNTAAKAFSRRLQITAMIFCGRFVHALEMRTFISTTIICCGSIGFRYTDKPSNPFMQQTRQAEQLSKSQCSTCYFQKLMQINAGDPLGHEIQ